MQTFSGGHLLWLTRAKLTLAFDGHWKTKHPYFDTRYTVGFEVVAPRRFFPRPTDESQSFKIFCHISGTMPRGPRLSLITTVSHYPPCGGHGGDGDRKHHPPTFHNGPFADKRHSRKAWTQANSSIHAAMYGRCLGESMEGLTSMLFIRTDKWQRKLVSLGICGICEVKWRYFLLLYWCGRYFCPFHQHLGFLSWSKKSELKTVNTFKPRLCSSLFIILFSLTSHWFPLDFSGHSVVKDRLQDQVFACASFSNIFILLWCWNCWSD